MENSAILTADILDIIFEGRNKEYGAYDLRKTYKRRLLIAMSAMLLLIILLFAGFMLAKSEIVQVAKLDIADPTLTKVDIDPTPPPPPPPPPKLPPPPQVQMARFTPPVIVKDDEVKPDDKSPVNEDLDNTKIGLANQQGVTDDNVIAPPAGDGNKGVIELPRKADPDSIFISVQIESSYPGGRPKWEQFLNRNLRYPQEAVDNNIQGTVVVQFIVDREGMVSNVEAVSGPNELREAAVSAIKKSGKWIPAVQNGDHVKSYKRQPIVFRTDE